MSLEKLSALAKEMEVVFKQAEETFAKNLVEAINDIPGVLAIRITQYTPGFNDGEPCTNSMMDPQFRLEGVPEDAGEEGDGFVSVYDTKDKALNIPAAVQKQIRDLSAAVESLSDVFERAYETDTRVTIARDGTVTVDDYDCGF